MIMIMMMMMMMMIISAQGRVYGTLKNISTLKC